MLVAAQVNRDAQIKVVSMSPAILVWYQIVTSCNLLVLVFKTVNCNKAVYIDMYFQFCGNGMTQMLSMLPVIRAVTKWRHLLCRLKCTHWCDHVLSYLSITSVTKTAPTYHVVWFCSTALNHAVGISAMAEELQKDRRQMQRRTERPPAQHCTSQFCLDRHEHFCPRNPCNWK